MIKLPKSKIEKCVSTGKYRGGGPLGGVYFDAQRNRLVAADGFIAVFVPVQANCEGGNVIVPAETFKEARRMAGRDRAEIATFDGAIYYQADADTKRWIGTAVDGIFPDAAYFVESNAPAETDTVAEICIDARRLWTLAQALCEAHGDKAKATPDTYGVILAVNLSKPHNAVRVRPLDDLGGDVPGRFGLIMPMHFQRSERGEW